MHVSDQSDNNIYVENNKTNQQKIKMYKIFYFLLLLLFDCSEIYTGYAQQENKFS